jgi:hypothetical protein
VNARGMLYMRRSVGDKRCGSPGREARAALRSALINAGTNVTPTSDGVVVSS